MQAVQPQQSRTSRIFAFLPDGPSCKRMRLPGQASVQRPQPMQRSSWMRMLIMTSFDQRPSIYMEGPVFPTRIDVAAALRRLFRIVGILAERMPARLAAREKVGNEGTATVSLSRSS